MTNVQVYRTAPSDQTYIKTEYSPARNGTYSEFQCDNLFEVQQLLCELQKACLAMKYFSIPQIIGITFSAIFQDIKKRLEMVFGQSA